MRELGLRADCSRGQGGYVRAIIKDVEFKCRASGRVSKYTIIVEWDILGGKTIEFHSFERWVRELAKSREWLVEELVCEIWKRVKDSIGGYTVVKAVGNEGDMWAIVVKYG